VYGSTHVDRQCDGLLLRTGLQRDDVNGKIFVPAVLGKNIILKNHAWLYNLINQEPLVE
jgi:hypothetical protein